MIRCKRRKRLRKYVRWRTAIFEIFKSHDIIFNDDQFNELFSYDPMFGTISFLGTVLDLSKDMDYYKEIIEGYKNNNKDKNMTANQLGLMLKEMYENAKFDKTTMIHLFGIQYIDLTINQFDLYNIPVAYEPNEEIDRKYCEKNADTNKRYQLLIKRITDNVNI